MRARKFAPRRHKAAMHGGGDLHRLKNRRFAARLGYALAGLRRVFRREKSFRTQAALALAALLAVLALRPGLLWAAAIALAAALVLALELVNSALEYAIDRLHPELHPEMAAAKDAAAAAVLLASLAALVVGGLMLLSVLGDSVLGDSHQGRSRVTVPGARGQSPGTVASDCPYPKLGWPWRIPFADPSRSPRPFARNKKGSRLHAKAREEREAGRSGP